MDDYIARFGKRVSMTDAAVRQASTLFKSWYRRNLIQIASMTEVIQIEEEIAAALRAAEQRGRDQVLAEMQQTTEALRESVKGMQR